MTVLDLETIQATKTRAECAASLLTVAESLGFNVTSWQSGSVGLTLVYLLAEVWSQMTTVASSLSKGSFNETATGTLMSAFARSVYDNLRRPATRTQGQATLACDATNGPHTIAVGEVVIAYDSNADYTYRNTTGGTLATSGTLDLTFEAEVGGANRNVGIGEITTLVTDLAGVTVNNPAVGVTGTWITSAGTDQESDAELRARNTAKWGSLTYEFPNAAYKYHARQASTEVTRVHVDDTNPRGAGTVDIYIATATGGAGAPLVATVQAYIDARKPTCDDPDVITAVVVTQNFSATIYVEAAKNTTATETAIENAITDYVNALDIGGEDYGAARGAPLSAYTEAVMSVDGVKNVVWTTPSADTALAVTSVLAVGTFSLSLVSV